MMDDILVFEKDEGEHNSHLDKVLERLQAAGMTLNKAKCEFNVKKIHFIGHVFSGRGIEVDPEKVKAIVNLTPSTNW